MEVDRQKSNAPYHAREETLEIKFYEYGKGIFLWPLLVFCPLLAALAYLQADPVVLGWAYVSLLFLVILAVTIDVSRNTAIVFLVVFLMLLFLCLYVDEKTMPVFQPLGQGIRSLNVRFDAGQAWAMAIFAALIVGYSIVKSRINGRWHLTSNELQHFQFGKQDDSLARGAKTFSVEYDDWLELLLGLSGTIIVSDANTRRVIRHVLLLPLRMRKIQKIISARVVVEQHEDAMGGDHHHDFDDRGRG